VNAVRFRARANGGITPIEATRREDAVRAAVPMKPLPPPPPRDPPAAFVEDYARRKAKLSAGPAMVDELSTDSRSAEPIPDRTYFEPPAGEYLKPPTLPHPNEVTAGRYPIDTWVRVEGGLRRWRAMHDRFDVIELPGDEREIHFAGVRMRLSAELSAHLSYLLAPKGAG